MEEQNEIIKIVNCLNCNKTIEIKRKVGRRKKYCSKRCRFLFWRNNNKEKFAIFNRASCKKSYLNRKAKFKELNVCSKCGKPKEDILKKLCKKCRDYLYNWKQNKKRGCKI